MSIFDLDFYPSFEESGWRSVKRLDTLYIYSLGVIDLQMWKFLRMALFCGSGHAIHRKGSLKVMRSSFNSLPATFLLDRQKKVNGIVISFIEMDLSYFYTSIRLIEELWIGPWRLFLIVNKKWKDVQPQ